MTTSENTIDGTPRLECRDLRFAYESDRPVIENLSATLGASRLCALIGPNAAGKTTLLRVMLGQLPPDSGSVLLEGTAIDGLDLRRRAALVSYVPQRGGPGFDYTVGEVVRMGRYALAPDAAAVDRAMELCALNDLRDRIYMRLSTGQQQRVLLARAIAQSHGQGRVMLLDEPVSAMDLRHVHHTMQRIRRLALDGLAVVMVLHDLNLAARYADDVWLMDRGRLEAAGPWREVLRADRLEPVYGMPLEEMSHGDGERPLFVPRPPSIMSGTG